MSASSRTRPVNRQADSGPTRTLGTHDAWGATLLHAPEFGVRFAGSAVPIPPLPRPKVSLNISDRLATGLLYRVHHHDVCPPRFVAVIRIWEPFNEGYVHRHQLAHHRPIGQQLRLALGWLERLAFL